MCTIFEKANLENIILFSMVFKLGAKKRKESTNGIVLVELGNEKENKRKLKFHFCCFVQRESTGF